MHAELPRRRVLVAGGPSALFALRNLFSAEPLRLFEPVEADSFARARFVMQHHPCELMLVNDDLFLRELERTSRAAPSAEVLSWLVRPRDLPVLVLTGEEGPVVAQAYAHGAHLCLPRVMAMTYPPALAAALDRSLVGTEKCRASLRTQKQLAHCRRHMDRLVHLIWRATPMQGDVPWGTQRYAVERLQEELARVQRHGGALTVAVGDVHADKTDAAIHEWVTGVVSRAKRRCDVAGQYGLRGFLLLMVQTPKSGGVICCRRLQRLLQSPPEKGKSGRPLRASFGLASGPAETTTPQALLRVAEENLELARAGRNDGVVAE
jgi:GGDEF domain-containing protein